MIIISSSSSNSCCWYEKYSWKIYICFDLDLGEKKVEKCSEGYFFCCKTFYFVFKKV